MTKTVTTTLDKIKDNPWQTRLYEDPAHVASTAESIKAHGLIQKPIVRPHPSKPGLYQLNVGATRVAAHRLLVEQGNKEFNSIEVDVADLSDRQMSDRAAAENAQRKDLSAIETGHAIARRQQDFKLTLADAAAPFGLTQSAASHIVSLTRLPQSIQDDVHHGRLAERHARALIKPAELWPEDTIKIANKLVKSTDSNKDYACGSAIQELASNRGRVINGAPFPLEWPAKPLPVSADMLKLAQFKSPPDFQELPDCNGCRFRIENAGRHYCARPPCYSLKVAAFAQAEAEKFAKQVKISIAGSKEQTVLVPEKFVEAAVKAKHSSLRIVAVPDHHDYTLGTALGTRAIHVGLATTDFAGLKTDLEKTRPAKGSKPAAGARGRSVHSSTRSKADDEKRKLQEAKAAAEREARAVNFKIKMDLVQAAAPTLGRALPAIPEVLDIVANEVGYVQEGGFNFQREYGKAKKNLAAKQSTLMRGLLISRMGISSWGNQDVSDTHKRILALAKACKLKLPIGWDAAAAPAKVENKKATSPKKVAKQRGRPRKKR